MLFFRASIEKLSFPKPFCNNFINPFFTSFPWPPYFNYFNLFGSDQISKMFLIISFSIVLYM